MEGLWRIVRTTVKYNSYKRTITIFPSIQRCLSKVFSQTPRCGVRYNVLDRLVDRDTRSATTPKMAQLRRGGCLSWSNLGVLALAKTFERHLRIASIIDNSWWGCICSWKVMALRKRRQTIRTLHTAGWQINQFHSASHSVD